MAVEHALCPGRGGQGEETEGQMGYLAYIDQHRMSLCENAIECTVETFNTTFRIGRSANAA